MENPELDKQLNWLTLDQRITELTNDFHRLKKERAIEMEIIKERITELEKIAKILMKDRICPKCEGTGFEISQHTGKQLICEECYKVG